MSRHPEVKWAQRVDKVYITVVLPDAQDAKVDLEPEGVFTFSATAGSGKNHYEFKLELFDKVNVEESKINTGVRSIFCVIEKAEKEWWKSLLRGNVKPPHYLKVDWDKWVDEDEDTGAAPDLDTGGMDFSQFGGMGGMGGGMGGMGGMPGMEGLMGGMGGMGGMEGLMSGMGGMGGMGGMPGMEGLMGGMGGGDMGDLDDSDDEEHEVEKPAAGLEGEKTEAAAAAPVEKKEVAPST